MPASCKTSRQAHATSNWLGATLCRYHGRNRCSATSACCALVTMHHKVRAAARSNRKVLAPTMRFDLATLVLGHAIIRMAITDSNLYGPASIIRRHKGGDRQRHIGADKGFQGLETPKGRGAVRLCGACTVRPPDHHDPDQPSGEDAVPESPPGLDEGPRFVRGWVPRGRRRRQRGGGADPGAFFARCSALAFETWGRQLIQCGREEEPSDHMDIGGELPEEGARRRATIGRHTDGACRADGRDVVDDAAGHGAARAIGHCEGGGQGFFEREFEANGQAHVVARPALPGETHDGPHQVDPPQRAICLSGGPGTVAVMRSALDMTAGLFPGGIIEADFNDRIRGYA